MNKIGYLVAFALGLYVGILFIFHGILKNDLGELLKMKHDYDNDDYMRILGGKP